MTNTERNLRSAIAEQERFMLERGSNLSGYLRFYEAYGDDANRIVGIWEADRDQLRKRWGALNKYLARTNTRRTAATRRMAT